MNTVTEPRPWYQEPWVWAVFSIPFAAVFFGILMVSTALVHRDDLVVDDYYKDGKAINRRLEMIQVARDMNVSALISLENGLTVDIEGVTDSAVVMHVYHVTSKTKDFDVLLTPYGDGRYTAEGPVPEELRQPGIWQVHLIGQDDRWKLSQRVVTPFDSVRVLP